MSKKKKTTYNLYKIDWKDACSNTSWRALDECRLNLLVVHSVGWLVGENKEVISLAQQLSANGTAADTINIPKSCIVNKYKLPDKFSVEFIDG